MRERHAFFCGLGLLLLALPLRAAPPSGALHLQTQPHVQVIWDGVALGTTDDAGTMRIEDIPPGQYRIQLQHSGYEPIDATVAVAAGESTLEFQLQPVGAPADAPSVAARPGGEDAAHVVQRWAQAPSKPAVEQPSTAKRRPIESSQTPAPPAKATSHPEPVGDQAPGRQPSEPAAAVASDSSMAWPWLMAIYVALAILLVGLGTLVVARRARPRGLLLQGSAGPFRQTSGQSGASGHPTFFDEIKRREVALEQFIDTGHGVQRRSRGDRDRSELEEEGA